jgi:hypothetical protein
LEKQTPNIKSIIKSKQVVFVQFYISYTLDLSPFNSPFQACPSLKHSKALSYVCESTYLMVQRFFHQLNRPSAVQIENLSHVGLLLGASPNFGPMLLTTALKATTFKLRKSFGSRPSTTC